VTGERIAGREGGAVDHAHAYSVSELGRMGDVPEEGILSRTLHADEDAKVVLFGFAEGEELSEHTASRPATIHVLSGELELTVAGDRLAGVPGTWLHMAAGVPHALRARVPSVMLLTLLGSPRRASAA
jgi:quercetin dioxygenase-like cupin family protein